MPQQLEAPARKQSVEWSYAGTAATVAMIGVLELLKVIGLPISYPGPILMLAVIFSAIGGGLVPGLVSAALMWAYLLYHSSMPGRLFHYTDDGLARLIIWTIATPIMAIIVGEFHRRALRSVTQTEQRRGEANTRQIIEHALDGVVTVDRGGLIVGWNPQAEHIFGRKAEDAIGRSAVETVIPERHRQTRSEGLERFIASDNGKILGRRIEIDALHRDGHEFPVELAVCPWQSDGGAFSVFVRDITDRRAAERRQELMMRELDHRVKNNLAAVLSIADQTAARSTSIEGFIETFRGRIMAMARLHSSLAASRWAGADLQVLVRQTIEPYTLNTEGRVVIRGSHVILPAQAVSSVSMALHELATNASKYGALSVPEGQVLIEWTRERAADGKDNLRLHWSENGGPPVEVPTRYGFGRQLIEQGVPYEVDGRANLEFTPSGVTCELIVPLAAKV